jgi:glycosyltransferase involved in cell wall biosynthesis
VTRAIQSALSQTLDEIEVIVVVDGPDEASLQVLNQLGDPRLRVKALSKNYGPGNARNEGSVMALGQWVAFLDDDDEWFSQKLGLQLQMAKLSHYHYPIITCRVIGRRERGGDSVWPKRLLTPSEPLSEYLFCRKTLFWGEGLINTSTIFTARELIMKAPFRKDLRNHEDFDWLLRASLLTGAGVEFIPCNRPLAIWHIEDERSRMSNTTNWHDSLEWIQENRHLVTPHAYASFVMTWISTYATQSGDWEAILPLLRAAYRNSRPTFMDVLVFWGNWLLPQKVQRRIASFVRKKDRVSFSISNILLTLGFYLHYYGIG